MKKRVVYCICILIFCTFVLGSCNNSTTIRRIDFVEKGSNGTDFSETNILVSSNLKDYKTSTLKIIEIDHTKTKEEIDYLKKVFDLENSDENQEYDDGTLSYGKEQKKLIIYGNGTVQYTNYPENYEMFPLEITDEEAIQQAENFLNEWELLPNDFRFEEIMEGKITIEGESPIIHQKIIVFRRYIDDIPVVGNCHIYVSIISSGIGEVSLAYKKYKSEEQIKSVNLSTAIKMMKANDTSISISKDEDIGLELQTAENLIIKDIELVYVEQAYDLEQTHVQPCYRLLGDVEDENGELYEFSSLVRAVPDSMTYTVDAK